MVGKEDIYRMLREEEIWHEITEHPAVYNMEEMAQIQLPYPEADAKNLFVRDSKRRDYYLITVRGDKRVDLKQFRQQNQTRSLSFASAEELGELLGLIPGRSRRWACSTTGTDGFPSTWTHPFAGRRHRKSAFTPMTIRPPSGCRWRICSA